MQRAIALSFPGVAQGGDPVGTVVARDGCILGDSLNAAMPARDPTAHAGVAAIRARPN